MDAELFRVTGSWMLKPVAMLRAKYRTVEIREAQATPNRCTAGVALCVQIPVSNVALTARRKTGLALSAMT